jgi:sugar lactone lactonase YvrE
MVHPVTIPNSIGWSLDNKTLYFTHSTERIIYAYDYEASTGAITNKRAFYTHDGPGEPDGFKIDVEGNLWQAVYGEACVLRISPEGKLIGKINLPTRNVTCPAFVGEDLFITTAAEEDAENHPESAKHGGGLFKVHVGIKGVGEHAFKLTK